VRIAGAFPDLVSTIVLLCDYERPFAWRGELIASKPNRAIAFSWDFLVESSAA